MTTAPDPKAPATWRLRARATSPIHGRRYGNGTTSEQRDDTAEVVIDRGIRGGKLDVVPLDLDDAITLALDLLDGVRIVRNRESRNKPVDAELIAEELTGWAWCDVHGVLVEPGLLRDDDEHIDCADDAHRPITMTVPVR